MGTDNHSLADYGINIPSLKSKSESTFLKLKNHPLLKKHINDWFIKLNNKLINKDDLLRVHSKEYIDRLYSDKLTEEIIKTYELDYQNNDYTRYDPSKSKHSLVHILKRTLNNVNGTYQCCLTALDKDFCFFLGGGLHHAQKDYGNGFCLLNDIIIAIKKLQFEKKVKNIWIIDVDAHKGDGTAALTKDDDTIITLSIHMSKGWPLNEKKYYENGMLNPSFIPSNIDIPIKKGKEKNYNNKLFKGLKSLSKYKIPDLAVVVSGADPYENDELESANDIKLTKEQLKERDLMIYDFLKDKKIPSAYLMAGGYGKEAWQIYYQFLEVVLTKIYLK